MKKLCVIAAAAVIGMCSLYAGGKDGAYKAGTYKGTGSGNNGEVTLNVTFSKDAIKSIKIVSHKETPGISDPAFAKIPDAIVKGQTLAVDAVSGATNTSRAILEAVEKAVKAAGGDAAALKNKRVAKKTEVKELSTDVVVAGAGASGTAAALAAVQNGAKVILLEKAAGVSGAGTMAGVMFADHSDLQKAAKKEVDSKWLYDQYIRDSSYYANARLVRTIIRESSDTVNWLVKNGMNLMLLDAGYGAQYNHVGMPATAHGYVDGGAKAIGDLHKKIKDLGGSVYYETPAKELLFDASHRVAGIKAVQSDGTTLNIRAKKVILATGGYGGNEEMMKARFGAKAGTGLVKTATGDGLVMAWSAGAAELGADVAQWFGMKYDGANTKKMPKGTGELTELVRNPLLFVDKTGKRFGDEAEAYESAALGTMMYNLPDAEMAIILDQGVIDNVAKNGLAKVFVDRWGTMYGKGMVYSENGHKRDLDKMTEQLRAPKDYSAAMAQAVAAGIAVKADSIESLAKALGMENLVAEVSAYNALCASGSDTQFFKDTKFLYPVKQGPYYAVLTRLRCLGTLGGVAVDERMQAVDADQKPIANLYVVGADAGGVYGNNYVMFEGGTLGFAYTSGKIAGREAAAALKR